MFNIARRSLILSSVLVLLAGCFSEPTASMSRTQNLLNNAKAKGDAVGIYYATIEHQLVVTEVLLMRSGFGFYFDQALSTMARTDIDQNQKDKLNTELTYWVLSEINRSFKESVREISASPEIAALHQKAVAQSGYDIPKPDAIVAVHLRGEKVASPAPANSSPTNSGEVQPTARTNAIEASSQATITSAQQTVGTTKAACEEPTEPDCD